MNTLKLINMILTEYPEFNGHCVVTVNRGRVEVNITQIDEDQEVETEETWKKAA